MNSCIKNSQHYARILIRIAQSKSDKAEITDILEEATKAANESRIGKSTTVI